MWRVLVETLGSKGKNLTFRALLTSYAYAIRQPSAASMPSMPAFRMDTGRSHRQNMTRRIYGHFGGLGFCRKGIALFLVLALAATMTPYLAFAQQVSFPSRPVHIVVPFSPGGLPDVLARKLGNALAQNWGKPVVIENLPGGGTLVGGVAVARAPADGHTILISADPLLTVNHLMKKDYQLNPFSDFAPVAVLARFPMAIGVAASVPANNLKELIELSQSKDINYGSMGPGTSSHLVTEMFKSLSGARMVQIPYRAVPSAMLALKAGEIQVLAISPGSLMPLVRAGAVRILAVEGKTRFPQAPDVPTFEEEGFGQMGSGGFWAIVAPARTPTQIVQKLNSDINKALSQSDFANYYQTAGLETVNDTPDALAKLMRETSALWAPTIKRLGIVLE